MLQSTVRRLEGLIPQNRILVATGAGYANLCRSQLTFLVDDQLVLEPSGKNTAPAVGLSAFRVHSQNPDAIIALMHSDHVIPNEPTFRTALQCAIEVAVEGYIVTLGIQPTSPHTGYGYIERGDRILKDSSHCPLPVYVVKQFLEKPNRTLAETFVKSGRYYWNGGIFIVRVDRLLEEYRKQLPDLYAALESIDTLNATLPPSDANLSKIETIWDAIHAISFDDGIMEGAEKVAVVPLDAGWNDVGSWNALADVLPVDENGNLLIRGSIVNLDSGNNIISVEKPIALIDVHDLVIIDTEDALLVGHRNNMQRVREVVDALAASGQESLL